MIRLAGTTKRAFIFPGSIYEAMQHYAVMEDLFQYLPHISVINTFSGTQFRVLFSSTELSIYQIRIYCDLEVSINWKDALITVGILRGKKPVKSKAGMHSSQGMAQFISTSQFVPDGEKTRVYYHLNLKGDLPKPRAFSLVPDNITNHIADNIATRRIYEIADGFIVGSLAEFKKKKKY